MVFMNLRSPLGRAVAAISLALALAGWCIMLGGLAATQHSCNKSSTFDDSVLVGEMDATSCGKLFSYVWFTVFLDMFILMLVAVALFTPYLVPFRVGLCALLAIVTVLKMDRLNEFYILWVNRNTFLNKTRLKVFWSGDLIATIFQFFLIIVLGSHHERDRPEDDPKAGGKYGTATGGAGGGRPGAMDTDPGAGAAPPV